MPITGFSRIIVLLRVIGVTVMRASLVTLGALFKKERRGHMNKQVHLWTQAMLRIVRARLQVINPYHVTFNNERPYIIMSNHLSLYDIPLIFAAFPKENVRMLAKKELFRIPIFGWGIRAGECVAIDRKNHRQAAKDLTLAKEKILSGIKLWIAPEGTRSLTGVLGPFKKGGFKLALETNAIILPVAIVGSNKILPAKTLNFGINEEITIHIGKPIDTNAYQTSELAQLIDDTATAIKLAYTAS